MSTVNLFQELERLYNNLFESFYSVADSPGRNPVAYISGGCSFNLLQEFREKLDELQEILESDKIQIIIDYIEEDTPIFELCSFDTTEYISEKISDDLEAYDENLDPATERYTDEANDIDSKNLEEAREDIKYLMEELLPDLLQVDKITEF